MKLADTSVTFLDLQTTGATPKNSNVLELAWCTTSARLEEPRSSGAYLIKQPEGVEIPGRISAITGISNDDMHSAVPVSRALLQMLRHARNSDDQNILVIHFAQFERPFLRTLLPKRVDRLRIYCTHQIAARLFPNLPSRGIRGLAGYFGLCLDDCKRAENHVRATVQIWRNLCEQLAERNIHTFDELDEWLATTPQQKRTKYEYAVSKDLRLNLPDSPGVYRMIARNGKLLYVGKATSLKSRVNSYFRGKRGKESRKLEMLTQTTDVQVTVCDTVVEACVLEAELIKTLAPPYNVALKIPDRPLVFYSTQFDRASSEQSEITPIGPFRTDFVMDSFVRFRHSSATNDFDPLMFFDELPVSLLEEAFEIFIDRHQVTQAKLNNARTLLALGYWLRRKYAQTDEELLDDGADAEAEGQNQEEPFDADEPLPPSDIEPDELSPEDVADKYERLLMRAAAAYALSKRLTLLLNATIEFEENNAIHAVTTYDGAVKFRTQQIPATSPERSEAPPGVSPWYQKSIQTFDRLRVLNTELMRIRTGGGLVSTNGNTPKPKS